MDIKAQSAMEYVAIVAIVMMIMVPAGYLYFKYAGESKDALVNAKVDAISNEIVAAAEQVYSYGEGSQTTLIVNFPNNIDKVEFLGNEIVFHILDSSGNINEIAKISNVNMSGIIVASFEGKREIVIKAGRDEVTAETKCNEGAATCQPCYIEGYGSYYCGYTCSNGEWERDADEPYNNNECSEYVKHWTCQVSSCVKINGLGDDECYEDDDCFQISTHNECNEFDQCVPVDGPGTNECNYNVDCVAGGG